MYESGTTYRRRYITSEPSALEHLEVRRFRSAADLRRELLAIPTARLVLHAAAVADYSSVKHDGKISSDQEELTIHLKRNPKILAELRDHFGKDTTIVGFKLLSGVSEADLISAAVKQMADNQTDYCIANDLQEKEVPTPRTRTSTEYVRGGPIVTVLPPDPKIKERRLHIVNPDGTYETEQDQTAAVARAIAKKILPLGSK